jgi:hypothetical protein
MKYGNTFELSELFSSQEKAVDFIQDLDKNSGETWWQYDYVIVEEKVI